MPSALHAFAIEVRIASAPESANRREVWLDAFRAIPCAEVYVWKPADMDEIASVL